MCTLAIYFQATESYPVVIAANRDEFLDRPTAGPTLLCEEPRIIGGKDLRAGGTWLAINQYGLVCGVLNRRSGAASRTDARSRGLLCLDALRHRIAREAAAFVATERGEDYNPFNLLIASRVAAYVAYNRASRIEVVALGPGFHVLTNLDVNDFECPRISASYGRFAKLGADPEFRRDPVGRRSALAQLLSSHEIQLDPRSGRLNSLCLHMDGYGTRSSSLIFVGREPGEVKHFFAPGPPCRTAHAFAPLLDQPLPK